jgi:hypothetical protein
MIQYYNNYYVIPNRKKLLLFRKNYKITLGIKDSLRSE